MSKRKREENVTRLDSCVTPVVIHHVTPAGERPPSGYYRNKCARLHNTTTSNSGRFDGARYRPLGEWAIEGGRSGRGEGEAKAMALCGEGEGKERKGKDTRARKVGASFLSLSLSLPWGIACIIYAFEWPIPNEKTTMERSTFDVR